MRRPHLASYVLQHIRCVNHARWDLLRGAPSNGCPYRDSGCGEAMCMGAWDEGFNWDRLRRISTTDQTCARQERDLRAFAKKAGYKIVGVWNEIVPGPKLERAERNKVLALAQARTVDSTLVTELTRWGRSARFAARSLTCFKVRIVSSPHGRGNGA